MNLKSILLARINYPKKLHTLIYSIINICKNNAFTATFFSLLFQILIFLILTSSDTGTTINIQTIFFSVPPLLVYFSFILLFLSFSYLFNKKNHLLFLFLINTFLATLIIGDLLYYRANSSFLSLHLLSLTSNLENLSDSIFSMFRWVDIIFILDVIFLGIYLLVQKSNYMCFKKNSSLFILIFTTSCIYLGYSHIKIDKLNQGFYNQTIFVNSWSQNQTISNLTPIGYHLFDAYNFLKDRKSYVLSSEENIEINSFFKNKGETLPDNKYKGLLNGKNLIILQVESLENFVINKTINGTQITPNINKLLKNSIYFDNFREQTHLGTTSDAELIANTSIFPVRQGSTFFRFPYNTYKSSLPELMEGIGYSTIAVHPDKGSYWNWLPALTSIGFDTCVDSSSLSIDETIGLGLSDESFLNQLPIILKNQPKPFFNFSVTLTSHTPFSIPRNKVGIKLPTNFGNKLLGNYIESINYTDNAIGKFIENLDTNGILKDSVVVIYGDHEGPHKYFKNEIKNTENIEPWMVNNDNKVPFIIYSKNLKPDKFSTKGGQIDILPTLSYLMGVDPANYTYSSIGRNLLNTKYNYTYLPNGNLIQDNLPPTIIDSVKNAINYSDIIIRSNHFRKE